MSVSDLPTESELIVKGRKAAYCARRLGQASDLLTGKDMEDLIQVAMLAHWKHHQNGRPISFCFICARQAAEKYFCRNIMVRNPRSPFSLDAPLHDGGDLPHERLAPPAPADNEPLHLDWLSDEILESVLLEARLVAGFSQYHLTRCWDTIQTDKRIVRLAANGHTNASIAELIGTTEGTIRKRRQRIRRLLEHLLPVCTTAPNCVGFAPGSSRSTSSSSQNRAVPGGVHWWMRHSGSKLPSRSNHKDSVLNLDHEAIIDLVPQPPFIPLANNSPAAASNAGAHGLHCTSVSLR